jgi:hypothetical protein
LNSKELKKNIPILMVARQSLDACIETNNAQTTKKLGLVDSTSEKDGVYILTDNRKKHLG